jgi:four helix bundle protein
MSDSYSFRNLQLWDRAQELTLAIIRLVAPLPRNAVHDVISQQIIKSSSSIAANVSEGHARFAPRVHIYHLSVAKGSTAETDSWLDLLTRNASITREQAAPLRQECMELMAMITAKIRNLEKIAGEQRGRLGEEPAEWEYTAATLEVARVR